MKALYSYISKNPVIYVTRDIERSLGIDLSREGYYIMTNESPLAMSIKEKHPEKIFIIKSEKKLDTYELLNHSDALKQITNKSVLVFKNTARIERFCQENNIKLLNPQAELANKIEEKLSQLEWLDELKDLLPQHKTLPLKDIVWPDEPIVVQYNHAHSGEGTILIENEATLKYLVLKFPKRLVRLHKFIRGPVLTSNAIVFKGGVVGGNISYQITGLKPFTDFPFSTVGNDWALAEKILDEQTTTIYRSIEKKVGEKMRMSGWLGLFGIDVVMSEKGEMHLLEINARQAASSNFESKLQGENTSLEAHLSALLKLEPEEHITVLKKGGQIFQRVTKKNGDKYPSLKYNEVVSRIEKTDFIMEKHDTIRPDLYTLTIKTLSKNALMLIEKYKNLPELNISCPYYNNKFQKLRAGLKVLIGKGMPEEISEEAQLLALKENIDLKKLDKKQLKTFLANHHIGIDCSGFVFHILDAEMKEGKGQGLKSKIVFPKNKNLLQKIRNKLRVLENTDVEILASDKNSKEIDFKEVFPSDIIVTLHKNQDSARNHILLINKVEYAGKNPQRIFYTHSSNWPTDNEQQNGVRVGVIEINNLQKSLTEQNWIENEKTGGENYTLQGILKADNWSIRRINQS